MNHPFPLNEKETALLRREEERRGITLVEWPRNPTYNMCFACGTENPIGLHLHFFSLPQGCLSLFTPSREHQSYDDRMHGGLIMTLMDEVMGNYLFLKGGIPAYTGKMESRFRQPILERASHRHEREDHKRRRDDRCRGDVTYDAGDEGVTGDW